MKYRRGVFYGQAEVSKLGSIATHQVAAFSDLDRPRRYIERPAGADAQIIVSLADLGP